MEVSQQAASQARENAESALKLDDLAGIEIGGEGMERITNMIKLVDSNTKKQISVLDRKMKRLTLLEADVEDLKANGVGANLDVKSKSGGFSAK